MAGRQPPPPHELLQGEPGSSRSETSFLDHFLRRPLESSSDQELCAAGISGSLPSPSNSIAALASNCDDLSPIPEANPWQHLPTSGPSSPTSQRDYYSQLTQSSLFPSSHYQRDLGTEYPWMQEVLEQQHAANSQAHNQSMDSRSSALEDVDWQRCLRGTMGHYHRALVAPGRGQLIPRRREQVANPSDSSASDHGVNQTDAFLFEEAAAAAWFRNSGYLRPDLGCREGRNENFAWLDSSGTQNSGSAAVPQLDHGRDVDLTGNELARMRWERLAMPSQFIETAATHRDLARELDAGALPRPSRTPPPVPHVPDAGALGWSTQSAHPPDVDTSLSSESGDDGSDDEEECTRSIDPSGSVGGDGDCGAKRKILEVSEDEGDDVSARMSSEVEPKRTSLLGPRKRSANTKMKPREPRYAIRTRTDVDIMDDGFKWRKYGQKAVKNSPHPRNYYRCTTPRCPVRKRVERSHEDAGLVITTYEGKHMHVTPGFHRPGAPSAGYFGERPRPGTGLFNHMALGSAGLGPLGGSLLPIPPEFSLAALHHLRALRSLHALAQQQIGLPPGSRLLPGSLEHDSLLRARHFLGLHDAAFGAGSVGTTSFGPAKEEPFPFTGHEFMTPRSSPGSHGAPYPGSHFPPPGSSYLDIMQMMRPQPPTRPAARGASPAPPRHLRAMQSDLDNFPDLSPDSDLVRRVLEAEEQELSGGGDGPTTNIDHEHANVDSSTFNYGGTPAAAAAPASSPPPPASPQSFASQIQSTSSLRNRVELERQRALQRPPGPPRASLRRNKAGCSSDHLIATAGTSQPAGQQQQSSRGSTDIPMVNGLYQEMVDQP